MKAARVAEFHKPFVIQELPIPTAARGEVIIKVRAAGLCASDLHIQEGKIPTVKLPLTTGHEFSGVIHETAQDVHGWGKGQHVIALIDIPCQNCRHCKEGRTNLCLNLERLGFERDGGHAEFVSVPAASLVRIPDNIPFIHSAIIADAVSCMGRAIRVQAQVKPGDSVLILGLGGLGFNGVQIAKALGARVYGTSRRDEKLKIAMGMGADGVVNTSRENLLSWGNTVHPAGFDVVIDNIGVSPSTAEALQVVKKGGRVVVVGYSDEYMENIPYQQLVVNEKELVGIRASLKEDLEFAVDLVVRGLVKPMVSDMFPLDQINIALERLRKSQINGRAVLVFS